MISLRGVVPILPHLNVGGVGAEPHSWHGEVGPVSIVGLAVVTETDPFPVTDLRRENHIK